MSLSTAHTASLVNPILRHIRRPLHNAPHVLEVAHQSEAYADDAERATDRILECCVRRAWWEGRHVGCDAEERGRSARIASAPGTKCDSCARGGLFDEQR